ncbi:MAG: acyl-CoA thioester hydrolase/BAAT C-terminal domain-containing protein [Pseudomonadota bacterium]
MKLPDQVLQQEDAELVLIRLKPGEPVSLRCETVDNEQRLWCSSVTFLPSGDAISTRLDEATGSYDGADVGGLYWALQPAQRDYLSEVLCRHEPLWPQLGPLEPLVYRVSARQGELEAEQTLVRHRVAPDVRVTRLGGPIHGLLFEPRDTPARGSVLVLGGSEGGVVPGRAAALAAEGFAALALAYFQYPGLPRSGLNLPLEYFRSAADWLRQRHSLPLCIWGASRGSEAAMLSAITWPELFDAVIAWAPSHLVNTGFEMAAGEDFAAETRAMWTLDSAPVAGVPLAAPDVERRRRRAEAMQQPPGYAFRGEFQEVWVAQDQSSPYAIPVNQLRIPMLAVAGEDDRLWPSAKACRALEQKMARGCGSFEAVYLADAGHGIGMPNDPRPFSHLMHWSGGYSGVENGFVHYGGTPQGNAKGARLAWRKVVEFLGEHLVSQASRHSRRFAP